MQNDTDLLNLASKFINCTGKNIFLTGKAGTGKTTFLRNVVKTTHKKVVVAAPTGIAAINAGGVTLHSLFQLPFGIYIPTNEAIDEKLLGSKVTNPRSLIKELKLNGAKRKLICEMELLIIDEVSMLRADTLDAIDLTLRVVRRQRNVAFGGLQILFIGDMQQLPPVVVNSEKPLLDRYYSTPYFFSAQAFANNNPIYIELEKIYRQTDTQFINLLNNIRGNRLSKEDFDVLNSHYKPNFNTTKTRGYINLTTHNYLADDINRRELDRLKGKIFTYDAQISGDFDKSAYPVDFQLKLKEGAQVMFVKNDYSGQGHYFNGKIGTIESLDEESITVKFDDGTPSATAEPYIWRNNRYSLNKTTNEIEELEIGTFTQFPIKLAWAITVHKSQGLTFQKAIIDVSRAFAPGQIYVALSRLTSLDGLVLTQDIPENGLFVDNALRIFANLKDDENKLPKILEQESLTYIKDYVINTFDLKGILANASDHVETYDKEEGRSTKQKYKPWAIDYRNKLSEYVDIALRFQNQLQGLFLNNQIDLQLVEQRIEAAINYFEPNLINLSDFVNKHIASLKGEKGIKAYLSELNELSSDIFSCRSRMYKAMSLVKSTKNNDVLTRDMIVKPVATVPEKSKSAGRTKSEKRSNKEKIDTLEKTLDLAKQGHTIDEIALARNLAIATITEHVAKLIKLKKLEVSSYIDPIKYEQILEVAAVTDSLSMSQIKSRLGDEFTYEDIKIALAGLKKNWHE